MGKIHDIANHFPASLTDDQKDELYAILKSMKPEDLTTIEEHRLYVETLAKLRTSLIRGMRLMGDKFLQTLESLLSVGEDGVYSNSFRFIYELIQNVDDCEYKNVADCHLDIQFFYNEEPGRIVLTYNEKGFKPENVFAITGIAEASKNISADKVEIGEKGLGFKSVFGIANRVLIQSGMFSFELAKNNFTVPVPRYENFKPVKGTRLELQMSARSCLNIFEGLVKEYSKKDSLLNKNPILFLNKLTHLKMYFDSFRYIEFDVQRSEPKLHGALFVESKAAISADMRYHTSSFDVAPHKETIDCYRYTKPIVYREEECLSRYGKDAPFSERRHNLIAVFPVAEDETPIKQGLLYSFLPTQVKTNAPIILHIPFKLDGSREFVDPQGKNAWFNYTLEELVKFIKDVYIDLARTVKQNIIRYLPSTKNHLFHLDNEKVRCLCIDGLHGRDICREKIFFTEENHFECADHIVSFGKDFPFDDQIGAYMLLNEHRELFIPPSETDMKQYGAKVIEDIAGDLFRHALLDDKMMDEILEWLEKSNIEINYTKLLAENCPVTFSSTSLSVIGKYSRLVNAIQQIASKSIKENKKPPFHIAEETQQLNQIKRDEIISLVHDADIDQVFERYLKNRNYCFFAFPSKIEFAVVADNGIALASGLELGAFAKASEPFDSGRTFSASLKIRQASDTLDQADESMDNTEYLRLLRGVRSSLKKAFGDRMYNSYVSIIAEAGADKNRFLSELLQNADDCCYAAGIEPEFILRLNGDKLEISYNEIGFSKANVRALTAIGESTKKLLLSGNDRSIGEKGVGFKSVFGVAEQVEIHSNGFDFRLTDKQPTIPEKCATTKGYIGTKMIFKMKADVRESFSTERILKLCTCLHNLKRIVIAEHTVKIEDNAKLKRRTITIDGKKYDFTRFVYDFRITDPVALSERNMQDRVIKPEQRIIIYAPENKKDRDFYVYSGLPVEIKSTVPLIIDAPFELTTSRENILKNRWNEIIREEMYNAIVSFMSASCDSGLDVLKYVGFTTQNGSSKFGNFTDEYLNKFDWETALKSIAFIPVVGSEQRVALADNPCVLVPEFISKAIKDTSSFETDVVNISGKIQCAAILELIGCRRVNGSEIYRCLFNLVPNYITNSEFRRGLYSYLANNQGNFAFESIGDRVLRLPIFPVKTTGSTKYINFASNIYTHATLVSHGDYFILDTEIMKIEQADKILSGHGRISPLTQEVYDAKYQKDIEALIENSGNRNSQKYIAEYLLKEYNRGTIKKFRNVLLGMKKKIPMLMTDGQYKAGSKYLNDSEQWFGGTLICHLIVEQTYRDFAKFLEVEDIKFIHSEGFDFEIDDVSDEDIFDVQYLYNYSEIIKYLVDQGLVSDEQIKKYNLEFAEAENEDDDYGNEDFPEKEISNPDKLKKHIHEQWRNKISYVERRYIVWKPSVSFDSKSYTANMYRSAINSKKCFCQMCGEKFDFRYIERNTIEKNPAYAWEQMYLSLCLRCSKDYILLRNNEVVWRKFIDEIMSADAAEDGAIDISIDDRTISFTATHLAEIQEIFKTQGWGKNAPKREPKLGRSEGNEDGIDSDSE
jgi:hypothetical protein